MNRLGFQHRKEQSLNPLLVSLQPSNLVCHQSHSSLRPFRLVEVPKCILLRTLLRIQTNRQRSPIIILSLELSRSRRHMTGKRKEQLTVTLPQRSLPSRISSLIQRRQRSLARKNHSLQLSHQSMPNRIRQSLRNLHIKVVLQSNTQCLPRHPSWKLRTQINRVSAYSRRKTRIQYQWSLPA